jgi:nucleoid DNA-binding protein
VTSSRLPVDGVACKIGGTSAEFMVFRAGPPRDAPLGSADARRRRREKTTFCRLDFASFAERAVYVPGRDARRGAARAKIPGGNMAAKKTAAPAAAAPKKTLSKSALIQAIAEAVGEELTRKQVRSVVESIITVGHRELKKSGVFTLPGFAKFRVVKKAATKARQGINPFTKQPQTFAAKPASKSVRARPIKAIKDALA